MRPASTTATRAASVAASPPTGQEAHLRALEALYESAPVNGLFASALSLPEAGQSVIEFDVVPDMFHAAGAAHGTVYFKMLDDAAFRKRFAGTAIKRIGRDRFVRNVAYALGNAKRRETALPAVERLLGDSSPLVRGAAVWALSRLDRRRFDSLRTGGLRSESDHAVKAEWGATT